MYEKVSPDLNFKEREKKTEQFWKDNDIFRKSIEAREGCENYTFYDGPPTANGKPHIGHVLTRVIKDMIPRYRTMKGYRVLRKAGWDTHGLPVELEVEKKLGLDGRPVILSTFGSQGARQMNLVTADLLKLEQEKGHPWQHILGVGSYGWEWFPGKLEELGVDAKAFDIREYIYDMDVVMAAADVVISRAGASACNEIAATGTPCILIPSPNVTDNHQEKNARAIADNGGAVLILEKDCTPERLFEEIQKIVTDKTVSSQMRKALQKMSVLDSAERLCACIAQLGRYKEK